MQWSAIFSLSHSKSDRLAWIDYAKGIAITMVVFRHTVHGMYYDPNLIVSEQLFYLVDNIGVTFRMPLFFLLSGVFFKLSVAKRGKAGYAKHKFTTIMYPYLVWSFIICTLQIAFNNYTNFNATYFSYLEIFYKPWGHWWFLLSLFLVSVLYLGAYSLFRRSKLLIAIFSLALYVCSPFLLFSYTLHQTAELFIFFVIGDFLATFFIEKQYLRYTASGWLVWALLAAAAIGETILLLTDLKHNLLLLLLFPIIGSAFTIVLANRLEAANIKAISFIRTLGQHSLYIYLLHVPLMAGVRIFMSKISYVHDPMYILIPSFLAGLFVPLFIYRTANKLGMSFIFIWPFSKKPGSSTSINTHYKAA